MNVINPFPLHQVLLLLRLYKYYHTRKHSHYTVHYTSEMEYSWCNLSRTKRQQNKIILYIEHSCKGRLLNKNRFKDPPPLEIGTLILITEVNGLDTAFGGFTPIKIRVGTARLVCQTPPPHIGRVGNNSI